MKILVIGGNRFFGKKLTSLLIKDGHDITLMNRGNIDDGFNDKISRIKCDRTNKAELSKSLEGTKWDLVFDQVCFDYKTAKEACEIFSGKTSKYIYTSTVSVYNYGSNLKESDFNPSTYAFEKEEPAGGDYGEAKRQAEVAFFKYADFPLTAVRFPVVIGSDDYTKRFKFHVDRIKNGSEIYFPNINAKFSFISSDDAAKVLKNLAFNEFTGPINAASPDAISLKDFIKIIEEKIGEKAILASEKKDESFSPYGIKSDWYVNCNLLEKNGLKLKEIKDWLPDLI